MTQQRRTDVTVGAKVDQASIKQATGALESLGSAAKAVTAAAASAVPASGFEQLIAAAQRRARH